MDVRKLINLNFTKIKMSWMSSCNWNPHICMYAYRHLIIPYSVGNIFRTRAESLKPSRLKALEKDAFWWTWNLHPKPCSKSSRGRLGRAFSHPERVLHAGSSEQCLAVLGAGQGVLEHRDTWGRTWFMEGGHQEAWHHHGSVFRSRADGLVSELLQGWVPR